MKDVDRRFGVVEGDLCEVLVGDENWGKKVEAKGRAGLVEIEVTGEVGENGEGGANAGWSGDVGRYEV